MLRLRMRCVFWGQCSATHCTKNIELRLRSSMQLDLRTVLSKYASPIRREYRMQPEGAVGSRATVQSTPKFRGCHHSGGKSCISVLIEQRVESV